MEKNNFEKKFTAKQKSLNELTLQVLTIFIKIRIQLSEPFRT